ncbi:MAG: ferritin family protein [Sedimentisphaerales bacterium]|jgi:rubrerythrin
MAISFNVDEIFEMAEQIERNAAIFYREAAQRALDGTVQKKFVDLASMEDGHLKIFREMRKGLTSEDKEQSTFDPDNEAVMYLQAMADSHGAEGKKDRRTKLTGKESIKEIFEIAVDAEKNSIVFYTAIKELVPVSGIDKVETIISEELGHLVVLKMELARLT